MVVLVAGLRAMGVTAPGAEGLGVLTDSPGLLDNAFCRNLTDMQWEWKPAADGTYDGVDRASGEKKISYISAVLSLAVLGAVEEELACKAQAAVGDTIGCHDLSEAVPPFICGCRLMVAVAASRGSRYVQGLFEVSSWSIRLRHLAFVWGATELALGASRALLGVGHSREFADLAHGTLAVGQGGAGWALLGAFGGAVGGELALGACGAGGGLQASGELEAFEGVIFLLVTSSSHETTCRVRVRGALGALCGVLAVNVGIAGAGAPYCLHVVDLFAPNVLTHLLVVSVGAVSWSSDVAEAPQIFSHRFHNR